ncbi:capsular polysaccharide export protein, LipB/KpsS family [Novosphingobium ovatum]|uniref:capsular polysaccharide export protein, LipB/KpsS family n=1 Tax=Novosphingobium ovatum TaxID=1908523 RepID=UPI0029FF0973|nr:hypothetical protein [Novosphingobium ovatum]
MLQGPPGPFFHQLGRALGAAGHRVWRINLNGGDVHDWPRGWTQDGRANGIPSAWRGRARDWPLHIDGFICHHGITDLVLFGDCRPLHRAAHRIAGLRGVAVHVFEEGYIRPDWLTLEPDGVNGHSPLPRNADQIRAAAAMLPPIAPGPALPPVQATMRRRIADSLGHYAALVAMAPLFPFYRTHRPGLLAAEAVGWLLKWARGPRAAAQASAAQAQVAAHVAGGGRYFLFPLQLSSDYQIRAHSPFAAMEQAVDYVLASFAAHAAPDTLLVAKAHPLDPRWAGWGPLLARRARALGIGGRVVHLDGGDLRHWAEGASGMVVVNSTSATFAFAAGVPVAALGSAVYALPGLTHQNGLDSFWQAPTPPDAALWAAFCRVLHHRSLVRGGLASDSAVATLVANAAQRLLQDPAHLPQTAPAIPPAPARAAPLRLTAANPAIEGIAHLPAFVAPVRDAVIGWGRKPSGARAQRIARIQGRPCLLLEDGLLRSIGRDDAALSLIVDPLGCYYDASGPSAVEAAILAGASADQAARAAGLARLWREGGVSKYNHAPDYDGFLPDPYVLVVDQVAGDRSVAGALAGEAAFRRMIEAALDENPEATVLVKTHPDVLTRGRGGYLPQGPLRSPRIRVIGTPCHPVRLLRHARTVYTVSSQLGFEALVWKRPLRCFGMPFYAGWGLSEDDMPPTPARAATGGRRLVDVVHGALIAASAYVDPVSGAPLTAEAAIERIAAARRRLLAPAAPRRRVAVPAE